MGMMQPPMCLRSTSHVECAELQKINSVNCIIRIVGSLAWPSQKYVFRDGFGVGINHLRVLNVFKCLAYPAETQLTCKCRDGHVCKISQLIAPPRVISAELLSKV